MHLSLVFRLALVTAVLWLLRAWLSLPDVRLLYPVPIDKYVHAGVFFCIPFLLAWATRWHVWVLLCGPIALGALEEYLQQYQPGRSPELADWLAGSTGVVTACLVIGVWRWWRRRAA
ncbi:VanZ family protein [Chitinibacter mangrovi]|uniref:VanZ family protein n=1 Tax=Chitinibacter mangrovi TaxID=3153927 RepID=UPI003D817819